MKRIALICLMLLISLPLRAEVLQIQTLKTDKGHDFWLVQDDFAPVISIRLYFHDGAVNDPENRQGLSLMVSRLMSEGAGALTAKAFQAALNDHAMSFSVSAMRDGVGITLNTPSRYLDKAVDLLHLSVTQARFDDADIGRIRGEQLARLRNSLKDPAWRAARLMLAHSYGKDHPYARNIGGTLTSLAAITKEEIQNRYAAIINKAAMDIAFAGDIDAAQASRIVDRITGEGERHAIDAPAAGFSRVQISHPHDGPQTNLRLIWPAPVRGDETYPAASILVHVLGGGFGSRLMQDIREEQGLTYGIGAGLMGMKQAGRLVVSTATSHGNVEPLLQAVERIRQDLLQKGITAEELQDAKAYLKGSYPLGLTSTGRIAAHISGMQADQLPFDYADQWLNAIESVSIEEVNEVIQDILSADPVMIAVGAMMEDENWMVMEELPDVE